MSKKDEHSSKWGVPLEEVAGKVSGSLVDPPDFQAAEIHANIKRGMEVPLSGVASMPDVIDKALELRERQDMRARQWVSDIRETVLNGEGLSAEEQESAIRSAEHDVQRQLLSPNAKMRLEFASTVIRSITQHLLLETAGVEGKRAEQSVDMVKALVLHEKSVFDMQNPKKERSLRHPLGG